MSGQLADMFSSLATAAGLSRPKKKFHFDVKIKLEELQNCTFLTGDIFAKVRLRDGGTFSALSKSCDVRSHIVRWGQEFEFHSKMYASPVTGELEPCHCKISVRKETKGGKSYKKLGYVKINLSEYAGAGATEKKYLLESYNESKHKPDNSILQVTITLKQTSGDSLFKVPRGATGQEWEFIETPNDEGIQPDIHPGQMRHSNPPVTSSLGTFNLGGTATGNGGSLQDVRRHKDRENGDALARERKANSASNLRGPDVTTGSIREEPGNCEDALAESGVERPCQPVAPCSLAAQKANRSSSFNHGVGDRSGVSELPPSGLAQHRRMGSWSQVGASHTSPNPTKHKRQQSLVSGQSSKSTSAYSTLSERSGGSVEGAGDGESISGSLGRKQTLLATSSRMEQSRVDPQAVINTLFHGRTFDSAIAEQEGSEEGLKIYVDKNSGTVTVAGPHLDRKNSNLQAIDVSQHKSSSSPRRGRMKSSSHANRNSTGPSSSNHEQSPAPPQPPPGTAPPSSSRSISPSSTTSTITATR